MQVTVRSSIRRMVAAVAAMTMIISAPEPVQAYQFNEVMDLGNQDYDMGTGFGYVESTNQADYTTYAWIGAALVTAALVTLILTGSHGHGHN